MRFWNGLLVAGGFWLGCVGALAQGVAATPPMGWNSWDSYGLTVTESEFRANAAVESAELKRFGWRYAVIDEGWFLRNPLERPHPERLEFELDGNGRYIPVPARFPSAVTAGENTGFAELGRWVHGQGLQFGIHVVRGIPRESVRRNLPVEGSAFRAEDVADTSDACPWDPTNWGVRDNAAGQAWYDSLLRQYAGWGVDLLKVDCISDHPYRVSEIRQIHLAIKRSGRPMVLSLSPGPTALAHAAEVGGLAEMWRISDDVWDVWRSAEPWPRSVYSQFDMLAAWAPYAKPGNWPDADMLPVGELRPHPDVGPGPRASRLTATEQRTMLSLWSMARSPLVLGANLTLLDAPTRALLENRAILRIDQEALRSREVLRRGELIVWKAELPGGESAVGFFNRGDAPLALDEGFAGLGYGARTMRFEDVWELHRTGTGTRYKGVIAAHGCVILLMRESER